MPLALADLLGRLPLRDHPLLCLLQCDQPVAVPLCHEKCPCIHLSRLAPSIGHFYLAQLGHYHLAATPTTTGVDSVLSKQYTADMVRRIVHRIIQSTTLALCGVAAMSVAAEPGKTVTFSRDVAPIFQAKCEECHHPGTAAPMSLVTYREIRPWAKSIREPVVTSHM